MKVEDLTPIFASKVSNIDLRQLTSNQVVEIKNLLNSRKVIFFEDQFLNKEEMQSLGAMLKNNYNRENFYAEINSKDNPDYGGGWHGDLSYKTVVPSYTAFQIDVLPSNGLGDTLFLDSTHLLSQMTPAMKDFLKTLTGVNRYNIKIDRETSAGGDTIDFVSRYEAEHPIVLRNVINGCIFESLFFHESITLRIKELAEFESKCICDYLTHLIYRPDFQYRHKWSVGSLVIWNNRLSSHRAVKDFDPTIDYRAAKRIVIY